MKALKIVALAVVVVVVVVVLAAPLGPLPGIFIGGSEAPVPASWGDTSAVEEIMLEVGEGMIPRVVIIWVVQVDGELHVVGAKDGGWTSMLGDGGPVRMRMKGATYTMQAERITDGMQAIFEAYVNKYRSGYPEIVAEFPAIEEAGETTSVYRLTAPGSA